MRFIGTHFLPLLTFEIRKKLYLKHTFAMFRITTEHDLKHEKWDLQRIPP